MIKNYIKTLVVGYGTGRCGTMSLALFLNQQPNFNITHEKVAIGWECHQADPFVELEIVMNRPEMFVGDISYAWVKNLWMVFRQHGAKAINIIRDDEEVIESFWGIKQHTVTCVTPDWYSYPFDSTTMTKDDIVRAIKKYRIFENTMRKRYPGLIYRMHMEHLNDEAELAKLLAWLGCDESSYVLNPVHIHTQEQCLPTGVDPKRSTIQRPPFLDRVLRRFGG